MSMGGGGQNSTTTTTQELSPEQRALIAPVIPIAQRYLQNPPTMFPGSGITGFNSQQRQAQEMTMNAANSMIPSMNRIPGRFNSLYGDTRGTVPSMINRTQPGTDFLTSGRVLHPGSNPALQGAIDAATRPAIQAFNEQVLPGITQEGVSSGGFGGTRQGIAEGIAGRGLQQTVADTGASMANTNYQAGLGAMVGGLNEAGNQSRTMLASQQAAAQLLGNQGNIFSQMQMPGQAVGAVGAQNYAMEQARLSEQVQRHVNEQMIPFAAAQDVAAMAFGMPGGTTRSMSEGGSSGGGMGAQLGMGALSILPALLGKSDRLLKTAIKKVEELFDGLSVYVYRFIDDAVGIMRIGLMADEVELLYPECVVIGSDGYKRVNYIGIPSWMGRIK